MDVDDSEDERVHAGAVGGRARGSSWASLQLAEDHGLLPGTSAGAGGGAEAEAEAEGGKLSKAAKKRARDEKEAVIRRAEMARCVVAAGGLVG